MYLFIKSKTTHNLSTVHRYGATQKVLYYFAEPNKKKPWKTKRKQSGDRITDKLIRTI